jgi:hypothetical protein
MESLIFQAEPVYAVFINRKNLNFKKIQKIQKTIAEESNFIFEIFEVKNKSKRGLNKKFKQIFSS